LIDVLRHDLPTAFGAVWVSNTGKEEAEIIVDLGDGPDGTAGIVAPLLLIDKDGRRQTLNLIDIGLVHDAEELAGVGAEGFDIAALAFGIDSVVSHTRLAATGDTGEDHELVFGESQIDVLEIVLTGSLDDQMS